MITIPLLILTGLYIWFGVWLCKAFEYRSAHIAVALLMASPAIYWIGSYQYVKYEHKVACERDGGLRVLIQPEKADRIQLDPNSSSGSRDAKSFLFRYFPKLALVDAWDGEYDGKGQKSGYFSYEINPATTALPKNDWKLNKSPLVEPTGDLYRMSVTDVSDKDLTTSTWKLERNGRLYASWTMYHHHWSKNPGMPIGWQCFGPGSPEWVKSYPPSALIELILK